MVDPSVRIGDRTCGFEMTWMRKMSASRGRQSLRKARKIRFSPFWLKIKIPESILRLGVVVRLGGEGTGDVHSAVIRRRGRDWWIGGARGATDLAEPLHNIWTPSMINSTQCKNVVNENINHELFCAGHLATYKVVYISLTISASRPWSKNGIKT